jgi:hypothetical protein
MNLDAYHRTQDDLRTFMNDALREYRELGVSLRIANEERERLADMLESAIDLLSLDYGSDDEAVQAIGIHQEMRRLEREAAKQGVAA